MKFLLLFLTITLLLVSSKTPFKPAVRKPTLNRHSAAHVDNNYAAVRNPNSNRHSIGKSNPNNYTSIEAYPDNFAPANPNPHRYPFNYLDANGRPKVSPRANSHSKLKWDPATNPNADWYPHLSPKLLARYEPFEFSYTQISNTTKVYDVAPSSGIAIKKFWDAFVDSIYGPIPYAKLGNWHVDAKRGIAFSEQLTYFAFINGSVGINGIPDPNSPTGYFCHYSDNFNMKEYKRGYRELRRITSAPALNMRGSRKQIDKLAETYGWKSLLSCEEEERLPHDIEMISVQYKNSITDVAAPGFDLSKATTAAVLGDTVGHGNQLPTVSMYISLYGLHKYGKHINYRTSGNGYYPQISTFLGPRNIIGEEYFVQRVEPLDERALQEGINSVNARCGPLSVRVNYKNFFNSDYVRA